MEILQIISLAIVQGVSEFLPISSSGHLILSPYLFGFKDQGLSFDVAVHLGSLVAVISYFRHDIINISLAWFRSLPSSGTSNPESRLGWAIIIGTIPVVIFGLLLRDIIESDFRAPWIIGVTTILFGLLLLWADRSSTRQRETEEITVRDAVFIGFSQVLALIPGTSRSGITMTTGLMLGFTRQAASRFSFLLSIPTILASSALISLNLAQTSEPVDWTALLMGVGLSAIAAYLCIHFFLRYIERIGMTPFVIYRLLLGALVFLLIW